MRLSHVPAAVLIGGAALLASAPAAGAAPPAQPGNCVSVFATTLAQAGVLAEVITGGAHQLQPFGQNAAKPEAHGELGACPFVPETFLP
jgi:hypothetical protein